MPRVIAPGLRQPYMVGCRGMGMGIARRNQQRQAQQILGAGTQLLAINGAKTFTRGTSAWDPATSQIQPPGYLRTKTVGVSPTLAALLALVEGAGTNLLAAGTSDNLAGSSWTNNNFGNWINTTAVANAAASPNGDINATQLTGVNATAFLNNRMQLVTVSPSTTYTFSCWVKNINSTSTLNLILSTGTGGTLVASNVANAVVTAAGAAQWVRLSFSYTIPASGVTQVSVGYFGIDQGASVLAWGAQLEQVSFPTSYISNRNLVLFSNVLNGTGWANAGSNASIASGGGTLPSGETAWTFTAGASFGDWQRTVNVIAGSVMTFSFWAKSGTLAQPGCLIYDNIHFANITAPNISGQIISTAFQRVTVTFTVPAGCTQIIICPGYSLSGTGTTFIGDCQLEYGATATGYWGTDATVGGRDADNLSVSVTSLVDARTNLLLYSEQFDNAAWSSANVAVTANNATDPNGNNFADTATASATGNNLRQQITVVSGTTYTFSWWAKAGTLTAPNYAVYDNTHSAYIVNPTAYAPSAGQWTRYSVTFVAPAGCTALSVYPLNNSGSSGTIIFWGAACVVGTDPGAGYYITTAGTAVTAPTLGLNTTAGTLIGFAIPYGWTGNKGGVVAYLYDDFTTSGVASGRFTPAGVSHAQRKDTVAAEDSAGPAATPTNGALSVLVSVWNAAQVLCYLNGAAGTPVASTPPWTASTALQVGTSQGANATNGLNGYFGLIYIPRALSAAEITALAVAAGF